MASDSLGEREGLDSNVSEMNFRISAPSHTMRKAGNPKLMMRTPMSAPPDPTQLLGGHDFKGPRGNAEGRGGFADIFAIGIDLDRGLGLDAEGLGSSVFHSAESQVATEIHGRKKTEEFKDAHSTHHAKIEFAIGELRVRRDLHASTKHGRIGNRGENRGFGRCDCAVEAYLHLEWHKAKKLRRCAEGVPSPSSQPGWKTIGTSDDTPVNTYARDAAEVMLLAAVPFADHTKIDAVNIGATRCKLTKSRSGIAHGFDSEGAGKVVAASAGNDKQRSFKLDQFCEMAVNGAVPAKDDGNVSLLNQRGPFRAG